MTISQSDFELLLQANRILSSKLDVDEVLQSVMELATKVVRAEASSLLLLDEKTNELYFDVALGSVKESVKQIRLKVGEGIAGWVAKERVPLIVNDVTKDQRFTGKVDKSTQFKTKSILAVPLVAKGKMIGVVEAINKEKEGEFSSQDQESFEIFASQAAVAIENARLFSAVKRETEKLNTVFGEMSDGVMLLDEGGQVILLNKAGAQFLGFEPAEVVGKKFGPDLFPSFSSTPSLDNLAGFKEKMTSIELVRREPKDFYLSLLLLKLGSSPESTQEGTLVMMRDETEEKREEMLKRNFLSLISHKLKTPLTVIVGYSPILASQADNLNVFQKKAFKAISEQGEHLSRLVDKLLRFSMVESENLIRNPQKHFLSPLVEEALKGIDEMKQSKTVDVKLDPTLKTMPEMVIDGALTIEVFKNLFENAIKFNDKDNKTITVTAFHHNGYVTAEVSDNGVGIPAEERTKIFQKFYQIENSFTGQIPGAGLGLALCKKIVDLMGGAISLQSEVGEGTTVSVTFPCEA